MSTRIWQRMFSVFLLAGLLIGLVQPAAASPAPQIQVKPPARSAALKPVVIAPTKMGVSPALRDLAAAAPAVEQGQRQVPNPSLSGSKAAMSRSPLVDTDAALQAIHPLAPMPAPLMSFDGIDNVNGVAPPDTQGDIGYDPATGKKYYVQWVNLSFAVWDVTAGTMGSQSLVFGPVTGNLLWQGFGSYCETNNDGDPITLYDPLAHRWLMSQFAVSPFYGAGPYFQCVAVSKTADPTGEYYLYEYEWPNLIFNDYPKFGVWPDGYYMTANEFTPDGNSWAGTGAAAFDRQAMLAGLPANLVYFHLPASDWGGMLPSDLDGPFTPAPGTPNFFVEAHANEWDPTLGDEVEIFEFQADWATPGASTFTSQGVLPLAAFDGDMCGFSRDCIPQPGTPQKVDAIADRTMYRLAYRNFGGYESLVSNLTVDADSTDHAGIRWFELRKEAGTWSVFQNATWAPDSDNRWMGSAAMDHDGNIAVGYSVSSGTTYPSVRYAGRLDGDPLGVLTQDETSLVAGSASQVGVNRWGDYSMLSIDPLDDCTFWYTQEYVSTPGTWNWTTRIGSFRFPTCAQDTGHLAGTITDSGSSAPVAGATIQVTRDVTYTASTVSMADGSYGIDLLPGTFNVTVSAYGYYPRTIPNVDVIPGVTTTRDVALDPAPTYTVSGQVTDANTGWPLYAKITIAGWPGGSLWNDPVTGLYSVVLAAGVDYTFDVQAWVPGYDPGSSSFNLGGDRTEDFPLNANLATCNAPGYSINVPNGVYEKFENWPLAGWSILDNAAGGLTWDTNQAYGDANYTGGSGLAATVDSNNVAGPYNTELRSPAFDLSAVTDQVLTFKLNYQDYLFGQDQLDLDISTDGGSNWSNLVAYTANQGVLYATPGVNVSIDLSAYGAESNVRLRWHYYTPQAAPWDFYAQVDDVKIADASCDPPADGGLVVGQVYDANTALILPGARVSNDSGQAARAVSTPDPLVEDAFFTIFSPAGSHVFTGTRYGYAADVATLNVVDGDTQLHDFNLPASRLSAQPKAIDQSLVRGESATIPYQIDNTGSASLDYRFTELEPAPNPVVTRYAKRQIRKNPDGSVSSRAPKATAARPAAQVTPLAAGDLLANWPTGLSSAWGAAFDALDNTVWVSSPCPGWGGDCKVAEYTVDGTPTGRQYTFPWAPAYGPADMTYDARTGMMWVMDVGIDNCIHELDPDSGFTGSMICEPTQPGWGATSMRALAYNPNDDTFFTGRWVYAGCPAGVCETIFHFKGASWDVPGEVIDTYQIPGIGISGMAFNPQSNSLYVAASGSNTVRAYSVAPYALLGSFTVTGLAANGMDINCEGDLWMATGTNMLLADANNPSNLCPGIDWLSSAPISGTVAVLGSQAGDIMLDSTAASIGAAGTYQADLRLKNNTPYGATDIPVTLHVFDSYTWNGSISSDWDVPANWTPNGVPGMSTDAAIPSGTPNDPVLNANGQVNNLTIAAGASLTIPAGFSLTAEGTLTNNGTLAQQKTTDAATDFHIRNNAGDVVSYYGVVITPTASLGDTWVSIRGNQACTSVPAETVLRCFDITPANTGVAADILFFYLDSEKDGMDPLSVEAWHWSGAQPWTMAGTTAAVGAMAPDYWWIKATGINSFSPFVLTSNPAGPTAIRLLNLASRDAQANFAWLLALLVLAFASLVLLWRVRRKA